MSIRGYILFGCFLLWAIMLLCICYAEEEFFEPFGFMLYNENGRQMKVLYDAEHNILRFRVFKSVTPEEYYEGEIPLVRVWEGEAE